jgi:hypothetical protein
METYLQVTGILFHIIVGGVLALSALFYWTARDKRRVQENRDEMADTSNGEVIKIGVDGTQTRVPATFS